jgi:DNA-binding response OmpR family regulator
MNWPRILIVDDDPEILAVASDALGSHWLTCVARDGEDALTTFLREHPDLIVLDLSLPKIDGYEVCRRVRESNDVPIIILSGNGQAENKIRCFKLGADDYVTKPFVPDELVERIQSVLRRGKPRNSPAGIVNFVDGELSINFDSREVVIGTGKVPLTAIEFNLLRELALNAGRVLTHAQLLARIWGRDFETERELIHVHIGNLRSKLESAAVNSRHIVNVRGVGYMFVLQG